MNNLYFDEAFKNLRSLNENLNESKDFSLEDAEGVDTLQDFLQADEEPKETVIDPHAQSEEELEDSYIGKVIIRCPVCHCMLYKSIEEIHGDTDEAEVEETEEALVNLDEECPCCGSYDGFEIIGEIKPYESAPEVEVDVQEKEEVPEIEEPEEDDLEIEDDEESEEAPLKEGIDEKTCVICHKPIKGYGNNPQPVAEDGLCCDECNKTKVIPARLKELEAQRDNLQEEDLPEAKSGRRNSDYVKIMRAAGLESELKEDLQSIKLETEDKIYDIKEKEKEPSEDEMIAPLDKETEDEINNQLENPEESDEESDVDIDLDDFDDEGFNEVAESYLKEVYENVNSFTTKEVKLDGDKLVVEGLIKFASGTEKSTKFNFNADTITKDNKVRFLGENLNFSRGKKSFILNGKVADNKFITESMTYNYRAKDDKGAPVRLYGTVRANKK